jgi:hypothetical protein
VSVHGPARPRGEPIPAVMLVSFIPFVYFYLNICVLFICYLFIVLYIFVIKICYTFLFLF